MTHTCEVCGFDARYTLRSMGEVASEKQIEHLLKRHTERHSKVDT